MALWLDYGGAEALEACDLQDGLQLGLTACDYGSSCFAEAWDFNLDPALSGAACGAMPANPYLVIVLDLFS